MLLLTTNKAVSKKFIQRIMLLTAVASSKGNTREKAMPVIDPMHDIERNLL